jgi:hypothetical protein
VRKLEEEGADAFGVHGVSIWGGKAAQKPEGNVYSPTHRKVRDGWGTR